MCLTSIRKKASWLLGRAADMDSQKQEFWKEAILKEKIVRLNWFRDNWIKPKLVKKVGEKRGMKLPQINEPQREAKPVKTLTTEGAQVKSRDEKVIIDVMRPVSGETRDVLYDGFSEEETGRYKYLLLRKRKDPEVKYLYPITSNWQYGWGLGDMNKTYVPMYAFNAIVKESFFRKNGVFPRSATSDTVA